jgi:hypothetical protein
MLLLLLLLLLLQRLRCSSTFTAERHYCCSCCCCCCCCCDCAAAATAATAAAAAEVGVSSSKRRHRQCRNASVSCCCFLLLLLLEALPRLDVRLQRVHPESCLTELTEHCHAGLHDEVNEVTLALWQVLCCVCAQMFTAAAAQIDKSTRVSHSVADHSTAALPIHSCNCLWVTVSRIQLYAHLFKSRYMRRVCVVAQPRLHTQTHIPLQTLLTLARTFVVSSLSYACYTWCQTALLCANE